MSYLPHAPAAMSHHLPTPTKSIAPTAEHRVKALTRFAISITAFTILGHLFLGFEQAPITPVATALLAYALEISLEFVDARLNGRALRYNASSLRSLAIFLLPAHISALACAMLLYAGPDLWPYLAATALAISVKHLIKAPIAGRLRHVMNPSNFGIAVVLALAPWVGIAPPYMFTANVAQPFDWLIPLGILTLGTILNVKLTGKWVLVAAWLAGFAMQALLRGTLLGTGILPALSPMTGAAFILFTNYMITDPGSTPVGRRGQIAFGVGCAAIYGALVSLHVTYTLFFALAVTCFIRAMWLWMKHLISGWQQ